MSYTYDQRKRPQGQTNAPPARTAGTGPVSVSLRADASGTGNAEALASAMRERMTRTFGDLSAVRDYQPPVRTHAPAPAGSCTGPVSRAVSDAAPSPAAAGPMQAKKYKETKSADRDYDEKEIVNEGAEGYDDLDDKKWMTVTRTPTGLARIFKKTRRFKARINRRAYDMTPEELAANKYNPGGYEELDNFNASLTKLNEKVKRGPEDDDKDYNGRQNRYAWETFQKFGKNQLTKDTKPADRSKWDEQTWGMKEIDQNILIPKLKNMSRMVRDYPELHGNIGTLIRMPTAEEKKNQPPKEEEINQINTEQPTERKKLRKRMKQQKPAGAQDEPKQPEGTAYMSTSPTYLYSDEAEQYKKAVNGDMKRYYRMSAFPLRMNSEFDEVGKDKFREERNELNFGTNRSAAELEYSGNHEMGHMLNFLLFKERYRNLDSTERTKKNKEDYRFSLSASKLVERALEKTMKPEDFQKLVRYQEDSLGEDEAWDPNDKLGEGEEWVTKDSDPRHKAGQIDLKASGLGGTRENRGHTSAYGATSSAEFFAEAFADVYRNGKEARPASIELVKLYEKNMKYFKEKNAGKKRKLSEEDRKDLLLD